MIDWKQGDMRRERENCFGKKGKGVVKKWGE